jgi:hypothetical protein
MKFNSRARAQVSGPGGACAGLVGVAVPLSGLMSSSLIIITLLGSNLFLESSRKAYRNRLTVGRIHLCIKLVIVTDSDKVST